MSSSHSTPEGVQSKSYIPELDSWVKYDKLQGEAICEVLVSEFLNSCDNALPHVTYLFYNSLEACISKNFLARGDVFVPFHKASANAKLNFANSTFEEKFEKLVQYTSNAIGRSTYGFFHQLVFLDAMFRNTDRHLANFGFIFDKQFNVRLAPVFDNGLALYVKEGLYWDFDNTVKGWGDKIKPLEVTSTTISRKFTNPFRFNVLRFIQIHDNRLPVNNPLFQAFLNILCVYFPTDCSGVSTKDALTSAFGRLRKWG